MDLATLSRMYASPCACDHSLDKHCPNPGGVSAFLLLELPADGYTTCILIHITHYTICVIVALASAGDGIVNVWRPTAQASKPSSSFRPHNGAINAMAWNHTGKVLATAGDDGKIMLSLSTGEALCDLPRKSSQNPLVSCLTKMVQS